MGKASPSISGQQTKLEERNHNQLPSAIKNQTRTKGQRKKDKRAGGGKAGGGRGGRWSPSAGDDELEVSWKSGATPQPAGPGNALGFCGLFEDAGTIAGLTLLSGGELSGQRQALAYSCAG